MQRVIWTVCFSYSAFNFRTFAYLGRISRKRTICSRSFGSIRSISLSACSASSFSLFSRLLCSSIHSFRVTISSLILRASSFVRSACTSNLLACSERSPKSSYSALCSCSLLYSDSVRSNRPKILLISSFFPIIRWSCSDSFRSAVSSASIVSYASFPSFNIRPSVSVTASAEGISWEIKSPHTFCTFDPSASTRSISRRISASFSFNCIYNAFPCSFNCSWTSLYICVWKILENIFFRSFDSACSSRRKSPCAIIAICVNCPASNPMICSIFWSTSRFFPWNSFPSGMIRLTFDVSFTRRIFPSAFFRFPARIYSGFLRIVYCPSRYANVYSTNVSASSSAYWLLIIFPSRRPPLVLS